MIAFLEQYVDRGLLFFVILFTTAVMASMFTLTIQRYTERAGSRRDDR